MIAPRSRKAPIVLLALLGPALCACSESSEGGSGIRVDAAAGDGSVAPPQADAGMDGAPVDAAPEETNEPQPGEIGAACDADADCPDLSCLPEAASDLPGGYCTQACGSSMDCPAGSTCVQVDDTAAICLDQCDPTSGVRECRHGYGCAQSFQVPQVCLPGCTDASDCPGDLECSPGGGFSGAGSCFDPSASVGDACDSSEDCGEEARCRSEAFRGYPGGACIAFGCEVETNAGCPEGAACIPGGRFGGVCLASCETTSDCREGYDCVASADYPDRTVCAPACTDDDQCTDGRVCNQAFGLCDVPFDPDNLGQICSADRGNCDGGVCLSEADTGFPDSICTYAGCDATQNDDADGCPGDGVCLDPGAQGISVCVDGCAIDEDCRDGYACKPVDDENAARGMGCLPACASDDVCGNDTYVCNEGYGLCIEPFVPGNWGEPCEGPDNCPGGRCLTEADAGWPAGACLPAGCRLSGEGPEEACPEGGVCVDDGRGDAEIGVCATTCTPMTSGACRPGYACVPSESACLPACGETDCSLGRTCNVETGLCE